MKAELRQGFIMPLEPLPADWEEGAALEVARQESPPMNMDEWAQTMEQLCADSPVEEEEKMRRAIEDHRQPDFSHKFW